MNDSDNKIDNLLQRHLAAELDPHLGRAQKAFAAELRKPPTRMRLFPRHWAAAAVLLLATSLAATIFIRNLLNRPGVQITDPGDQLASQSEPLLMPVAQTVDWHTVDDGTVMLNGDVTLGVAGIDLVYLRLSSIFCAADRIMPPGRRAKRRRIARPMARRGRR